MLLGESKSSTRDLAGREGDPAPEPQPGAQALRGVETLHKHRSSGQVPGNGLQLSYCISQMLQATNTHRLLGSCRLFVLGYYFDIGSTRCVFKS